jgi:uncharacterized membrane-anchored protein
MNKTTLWFALALALQIVILIGVPAQKMITLRTGRSVILKVRPVDPYNILSGYYVTLGYDISRSDSFATKVEASSGATVFAVVEQQADGVWKPVELTNSLPDNLPNNRAAIRGQMMSGSIEYGIEQFFIPETKRTAIEEDLRKHLDQARVEVKVDDQGNAALVKLLIEDRVYGN